MGASTEVPVQPESSQSRASLEEEPHPSYKKCHSHSHAKWGLALDRPHHNDVIFAKRAIALVWTW